MLHFNLYYEKECDCASYQPIQAAILSGNDNMGELSELFDDWLKLDEAIVDLAVKQGWNINSFIENELTEMASSYVEHDCSNTDSLRKLLVEEAWDYIFQQEQH